MRFPDNIKCLVFVLANSARWWHEYGDDVLSNYI